MRVYRSRRRKTASGLLLWLGMGLTTAVLGHTFRDQAIETHVVRSFQPVGYATAAGAIKPGDGIRLVRDAAMPEGYERVYAEIRGERVGFLPDLALRQGLREVLSEGVPARGTVVAVDELDPARGLTIRVTLGP